MSGLSLIVRFENQSPDYAYGFEAGRIYEAMMQGAPIDRQAIHAINLKQVQEIAIAKNYLLTQFSGMEETGTWVEISAIPATPKLSWWKVGLWAMAQPFVGAWTILRGFVDAGQMVWKNRR